MSFFLLWIFYHALIICQGNNHFMTKRNTEEMDNLLQSIENSEDDSLNSESYDDDLNYKLKKERALDPHFIPIRETEDDFEYDYFDDDDLKMEKSLFPAMRQFPSMFGTGGQQPNPGMPSIPNQMPSNNGIPPGLLGRPQNGALPSGIPGFPNSFNKPMSNPQGFSPAGSFSNPPSNMVPFQGASPGLNNFPQQGVSSPTNFQRPNNFPNGINSNPNPMSPFTSGSPNMFGTNPNSRFSNGFQPNPATNFPTNQPSLSPQRSAPLAMPLTGPQSFPQQSSNPFSSQPSNQFSPQPVNQFPQPPPNSFPQPPANPLPQPPANPFPQQPANPFPQQSANPFPQQSANPFPQQSANPFMQQPVNPFFPQHANIFPQKQPSNPFPQQTQPALPLPQQSPVMPFPPQQPALALPQSQPVRTLPQTQPQMPAFAQPSAKPTLPVMTNPLSSLFPYFFLPFPFGK